MSHRPRLTAIGFVLKTASATVLMLLEVTQISGSIHLARHQALIGFVLQNDDVTAEQGLRASGDAKFRDRACSTGHRPLQLGSFCKRVGDGPDAASSDANFRIATPDRVTGE